MFTLKRVNGWWSVTDGLDNQTINYLTLDEAIQYIADNTCV